MTTIELRAWDSTTTELAPEQVAAVAAAGLVKVLPERPPRTWRLVADQHVGVVAGDDWEVRVVPRLAIPRLMFLLAYAADPRGWRDAPASFGIERELLPAIASGFALHAQRAVSPAPARGYVSVEEQQTMLRGRLRSADQIARWPGLALPLELTCDDHTVDIAENRLLRGATELLLRVPRVPLSARRRLLGVRAALHDARPTAPGARVAAPPITRLNAHYRVALTLAELILRNTSIAAERGTTHAISFVFDMNKVFEDFVAAALGISLERFGGHVRLQYDGERLDRERRVKLVPDITWWREGACQAVIDAKFKDLADGPPPNADIYQMLAYCIGLGLCRGCLVYATDAGRERDRHRIRHAEVEIAVTVLDVEQPPAVVLAQVDGLAAGIAEHVCVVARA